jgi:hypothetical protein
MKHIKNILIVIGSMMIAGVAFVMVGNLIDAHRAKVQLPIREQCTKFEDALNVYKANYGDYPSTKDGLEVLLAEEDLRKIIGNTNLLDPWGTPFRYRIIDGRSHIDSAGPDKKFDTSDDIHSFH